MNCSLVAKPDPSPCCKEIFFVPFKDFCTLTRACVYRQDDGRATAQLLFEPLLCGFHHVVVTVCDTPLTDPCPAQRPPAGTDELPGDSAGLSPPADVHCDFTLVCKTSQPVLFDHHTRADCNTNLLLLLSRSCSIPTQPFPSVTPALVCFAHSNSSWEGSLLTFVQSNRETLGFITAEGSLLFFFFFILVL